jgi:hypothetical protein
MSLLVSGGLALLGVVLYYILEIARFRNWCGFEDRYAEDNEEKQFIQH